ncbi:MAG: hypothetical protein ACTSVV_11415 [Promethearchaeota archaeon]
MKILDKFIKELQRIKKELKNKEIVIKAENGLLLPPEIKFILKIKQIFLIYQRKM